MPYQRPTSAEALINRFIGLLPRIGIGPRYLVLLQVRGRKSGRLYSTPVNLVDLNGQRYLVAPRGDTQWARNAAASGEVTLVRGLRRETVKLTPIADANKTPILKTYLDHYASAVQQFFPVPAGSPLPAFVPIAANYPVFQISSVSISS
jgi:deazaflavin-dependent oxidoreductase (nitroreductase family)